MPLYRIVIDSDTLLPQNILDAGPKNIGGEVPTGGSGLPGGFGAAGYCSGGVVKRAIPLLGQVATTRLGGFSRLYYISVTSSSHLCLHSGLGDDRSSPAQILFVRRAMPPLNSLVRSVGC